MPELPVADLTARSTFIFTGNVVGLGDSVMRMLPPHISVAVARFERALRVNPMLGDLNGKPITVRLAGGDVRLGERLIFFANSWLHGAEIAVVEVAHMEANEDTEKEVTEALESLPERHLRARVASAQLIVIGTVREVVEGDVREPITEHAADWKRAVIEVREIVKEEPGKPPSRRSKTAERQPSTETSFYFPQSMDRAWRDHPKVHGGQSGVFLLHRNGPNLPPDAWVAPDPADVQPADQAESIRRITRER
jgi:hypothetical protein